MEQIKEMSQIEDTEQKLEPEVVLPAEMIQIVLEEYQKKLSEFLGVEEKLSFSIGCMRQSLAQNGIPQFREFWEIKKECLLLFKENITNTVRSKLWEDYSEICGEARRLKTILDEESAFAVEQIDKAIEALEGEVKNVEVQLEKIPDIDFEIKCEFLEKRLPEYNHLQRKLNLLNVFAAQVNGLRKELMRTDMRIRFKNKFFQRLSLLGDAIFPGRKQLIKEVSVNFEEDVNTYVKENFSSEVLSAPIYTIREEIKSFQTMAKILTLNTHAFTATRSVLSESWDKVKHFEKEWKKDRSERRVHFKENEDILSGKIQSFVERFKAGEFALEAANEVLNCIQDDMRDAELGKDEVKHLKNCFFEARELVRDQQHQKEQERIHKKQEQDREKQERAQQIKERVAKLLQDAETLEAAVIEEMRKVLQEDIQKSTLHISEKQSLEKELKSLKDVISDKREKQLLEMSAGDRDVLQQLQQVLQQRKERRQEIKAQIEVYRKASGSSGLDFEKAMNYNQQMSEEKERLQKIDQGILEVETKIRALKT